LRHAGWPDHPDDLPWVTPTALEGRTRYRFPACGPEPLGFYPIVPDVDWVERLLDGAAAAFPGAPVSPVSPVSTIQLRIKHLTGDALDLEIARACAIARRTGARLFINDDWERAIRHGAYGVHLGQEDLRTADLARLQAAGLHLGVSTHCYWEVARALAPRPSYIAIGPVFPTTTKAMRFAPQGLEGLRRWRGLLPDLPLVAIAGIFLENAPAVLETGVDGIAVVRDILHASDPTTRAGRWTALFKDVRPAPGRAPAPRSGPTSGHTDPDRSG
jgi:hydroxymethylpyrimidine kinase/phosphomethylpyrimidine kinase/thiamine-phosphate diphosphorylase